MKRKHTHTYKCEECDQQFFKKNDHKLHLKTHNKEKPYSCNECPGKFSLKSYLDKHRQDSHSRCCEESFPNRTAYSRHVRSHLRKKHLLDDTCCNDCKKLVVMEALASNLEIDIAALRKRLQQ